MRMFLYIIVIVILSLLAWIRLAPSDPARWHQPPRAETEKTFKSGAIRIRKTGPEGLAALAGVAAKEPRTRLLAGSVEEGMITWVSRSLVFGFPDYTTARQSGDTLVVYARQRFGRSDLGVNAARIERWLAQLEP